MLPQPIFSFDNLKDLDTIVELKRLQKEVTYFCTRPLYPSIHIIWKFEYAYFMNKIRLVNLLYEEKQNEKNFT